MSDSEVVKCQLKGHEVVREQGETKCLTEGGRILKERSFLEKMRYEILGTRNKELDFFSGGLLVFSAIPLVGFIAPAVCLSYRLAGGESKLGDSERKSSNTIIHYGFILSVLSNLILLILLIYGF